jgi:hypothetical protein
MMEMMSEAYLKSRIGMSGESDLPAWLMEGEYRGTGRGAILKELDAGDSPEKPSRNTFWHLPKRKEVRS